MVCRFRLLYTIHAILTSSGSVANFTVIEQILPTPRYNSPQNPILTQTDSLKRITLLPGATTSKTLLLH